MFAPVHAPVQLLPGFAVRRAVEADVAGIVALLRDDAIAESREIGDTEAYLAAFAAIDADANQFLAVVDDDSAGLAATMQLTLIPGLSRGGSTRLQIEAVRVAAPHRRSGLGAALLGWAEEFGRGSSATLAQLTSDTQRERAVAFYERHGYVPSHVGFKKHL